MESVTERLYAVSLDEQDVLGAFRSRFVADDSGLIYLDGNSLGRLPQQTAVRLQRLVAQEWGERLIRGWNEDWLALQSRIGGKMAQLLGAQADEVLMADSTSVNLYKLALTAVLSQNGRSKIITDDLNFPSDLYILQSVAQLTNRELVIVPSPDGIHGPMAALAAAIDDQTALVALSHTVFKSGFTYDMVSVTALARRVGALMLWDMSHSVGAVPGQLTEAGAHLAVGCSYKYVNGGPGAPAFLYVRRDLQEQLHNPVSGWMGQRDMFEFGLTYAPAPGLRRFLTGTPPILSLAAIEPGVDLLLAAGMAQVRQKSLRQTSYLVDLWAEWLRPLGFTLYSPPDAAQRGSHISLGHVEGWRIDRALIEQMNVLPDFRQPNLIRFGIAPLYNSYLDIYTAVCHLRTIVTERLYEKYSRDMTAVT